MALRLHQNLTNCPKCGFYLWEVWNIVVDLLTGGSDETLEEAVCPKCRPDKWNEILPYAVKFEPLQTDARRNIREAKHKE